MSKIRKGVMVNDVLYSLIPYEEIEDLIKEGMSICDICDLCSECNHDDRKIISDMCLSNEEVMTFKRYGSVSTSNL